MSYNYRRALNRAIVAGGGLTGTGLRAIVDHAGTNALLAGGEALLNRNFQNSMRGTLKRNATRADMGYGGRRLTVRQYQGKFGMNRRTGGLMGMETKYHDFHWNQLVQTSALGDFPAFVNILDQNLTVPVDHLTPVDQGTGETQRVGRNIFVRSINLKMFFHYPENSRVESEAANVTARGAAYCTVWIVMDRQSNKTTPIQSEIWSNPAVIDGGGGSSNIVGNEPFINIEWRDRFKIMKKFNFRVNPSVAIASDTGSATVIMQRSLVLKKKWFKSFRKPLKQQYDGITGQAADVTNWTITMWMQYNDQTPSITPNIPLMTGIGRIRYTS